jgi:cytoskeleton protein RodZ
MAAVQSIGERLREARMRQKIDVADVETATKIRAKYLRALENEEFGLLPGPTFVKTFLRTYAEYLGLDAQLLVEEYRVQYEPRGEEMAPIATSSPRSPGRGRGGGGRAGGGGRGVGPPGPGVVFGGIFVLLLAVIIFLGLTADDKGSGGGGTKSSDTASKDSKAKARERERARAKRAAAKRRRQKAAQSKVVRLRLTPSSPVYACVVDGSGKRLFGGTLSQPQSFKSKHIRINLGRPDVGVTVQKKRLKIPPGSNPVGYDLRAGKQPRPLPLGQRPNC